jgi:hypothetical protein
LVEARNSMQVYQPHSARRSDTDNIWFLINLRKGQDGVDGTTAIGRSFAQSMASLFRLPSYKGVKGRRKTFLNVEGL